MLRSKPILAIAIGVAAAIIHFSPSRNSSAEEVNPPASLAAAAATADQPETLHFVLHPALPPYAALKYRLLPKYIEQSTGNAAPNYMRAVMVWTNDDRYPPVADKIGDWADLPLAEFRENKEAQDFFNGTGTNNWDLIRLAARRETCDWELPLREYSIGTLIPELQKIRQLANLIAFKAHLEISRGQFDEAIETLKIGFAMARQVTQSPTLVNDLVGVSISMRMLQQVETLIQQPGAPNLYWTLSSLPNPLVDLYAGLGAEQDFLYMYIPELKDVRTAQHTAAEWDSILFQVANKLMKAIPATAGKGITDLQWLGTSAMFAVTAYPKAKVQLKNAGYSDSKIKAMTTSQAILVATVETYDHLRDELNKWLYMSLADSFDGLKEVEKEVNGTSEAIPLSKLLLPGLRNVKITEVRLAREVAALRCLEALRLYAAKHDGQLPKQLADIKAVPIPENPATGKPFDYEVHGASATIISPPPLGAPQDYALRWDIKMEPVSAKKK